MNKLSSLVLAGVLLSLIGCAYQPTIQDDDVGRDSSYGYHDDYADYYYDDLRRYGDWIVHVDFGRVWQPYNVPRRWRPYSEGHWIWRSGDWHWKSDYLWGDKVFHYGQWFRDRHHGWLWVPGRTFAPAWVSWRHDDDWVGWAPKPPQGRRGYRHDPDYHDYLFVEQRHLDAHRLGPYLKWGEDHRPLFNATRPGDRYRVPPGSRRDSDNHRDDGHRRGDDRYRDDGRDQRPHDGRRDDERGRPGLAPPSFPGEAKPQPHRRPITPRPHPGASRPEQRHRSEQQRPDRREERRKHKEQEEKQKRAQEVLERLQQVGDDGGETPTPAEPEERPRSLQERLRMMGTQ